MVSGCWFKPAWGTPRRNYGCLGQMPRMVIARQESCFVWHVDPREIDIECLCQIQSFHLASAMLLIPTHYPSSLVFLILFACFPTFDRFDCILVWSNPPVLWKNVAKVMHGGRRCLGVFPEKLTHFKNSPKQSLSYPSYIRESTSSGQYPQNSQFAEFDTPLMHDFGYTL